MPLNVLRPAFVQFMALYSTIQFANALLAVWAGSFLSNNEYMWQDLFIVFVLALTLGSTPSASRLTRKRPSGRLLSAHNLALCAGFVALTIGWQAAAFGLVRAQHWYPALRGTHTRFDEPPTQAGGDSGPAAVAVEEDDPLHSAIPETTSLFLMASVQYVAVAAIFSHGLPWKRWVPVSNPIFTGWLLLVTAVSLALFLWQWPPVYALLSLQTLPYEWNLLLLGVSLASFASYFAYVGLLHAVRSMLRRRRRRRRLADADDADTAARSLRGCCFCCCQKGAVKPHKRIRQQWQMLFAGRLPGAEGAAREQLPEREQQHRLLRWWWVGSAPAAIAKSRAAAAVRGFGLLPEEEEA
jgi:hypothetical protein